MSESWRGKKKVLQSQSWLFLPATNSTGCWITFLASMWAELWRGWCVSHDSVSLSSPRSRFLNTPPLIVPLSITRSCLLAHHFYPILVKAPGGRQHEKLIGFKGDLDRMVLIGFKNKKGICDLSKSSCSWSVRPVAFGLRDKQRWGAEGRKGEKSKCEKKGGVKGGVYILRKEHMECVCIVNVNGKDSCKERVADTGEEGGDR